MTLADLEKNSSGRILNAAEQQPDIQSRFYALGLFPGANVRVLRYAPAGDPIQIKVDGTLLSIPKQEALLVEAEANSETDA